MQRDEHKGLTLASKTAPLHSTAVHSVLTAKERNRYGIVIPGLKLQGSTTSIPRGPTRLHEQPKLGFSLSMVYVYMLFKESTFASILQKEQTRC